MCWRGGEHVLLEGWWSRPHGTTYDHITRHTTHGTTWHGLRQRCNATQASAPLWRKTF